MKLKLKLTWKIWLLIFFILFSLISIFVSSNGITFFQKGVLITSIETNSTAFEQGLRKGQIITEIDGKQIEDANTFSEIMQEKYPIPINLNPDENTTSGNKENIKTTFKTKDSEVILFSKTAPEITISQIPKTNIKTGLDLSGGSRALVTAENVKLSSAQVNDLVDITSNRLNEFGISDVKVLPVSDLSGNYFMLVEIAGATPKDLREILSKQGKFEAKIGNETVFIGGERDIASVSRNAQDSRITTCGQLNGGYACNFIFSIFLSEEAARRHAEITAELPVNSSNPEYLTKPLDLYLDDQLVDSLLIGESLKGHVTTQISISGSGAGLTEEEAYADAEESMHKLQTILITGSLPFKLEIVKLDTISPVLGEEFIKSIFVAGFTAILAVAIIIFIRYRKIKSSLALLITSLSEVVIILGIASFIEWNLDLPSIAGILATIGTGIDQQIIILDESRSKFLNIKQRLKRAFSIILGAYFTVLVAMLPLMWAGAGLLKGFAITTIIGITAGVLITRPAFTDMIRKIEED